MQRSSSAWRWFVIFVEGLLITSWSGLILFQLISDRRIHHQRILEDICGGTFLTAMLFLLFVLPWFWASLRRVALIGWLLGLTALLYLLLAPPAR